MYQKDGIELQLVGFPFIRGNIRSRFPEILHATKWHQSEVHFRILCLHNPFDGGEVGIQNFKFLNRPDTLRLSDLPNAFDLVLAGHLHRAQILKTAGQTPVIFNGSIERTSFVERLEKKGYHCITLTPEEPLELRSHELPTRPMFLFKLEENPDLNRLISIIRSLPNRAYIKLIVDDSVQKLSTTWLRDRLPETMIVELRKVK